MGNYEKAVKNIKLNMKNFRDQDTVLVNSYCQAAGKEYRGETLEGLSIHATQGLHGFLETLIQRHIPEGWRYCRGELQTLWQGAICSC
jgi:hypothetical protein